MSLVSLPLGKGMLRIASAVRMVDSKSSFDLGACKIPDIPLRVLSDVVVMVV